MFPSFFFLQRPFLGAWHRYEKKGMGHPNVEPRLGDEAAGSALRILLYIYLLQRLEGYFGDVNVPTFIILVCGRRLFGTNRREGGMGLQNVETRLGHEAAGSAQAAEPTCGGCVVSGKQPRGCSSFSLPRRQQQRGARLSSSSSFVFFVSSSFFFRTIPPRFSPFSFVGNVWNVLVMIHLGEIYNQLHVTHCQSERN